jgi:hypothetical protein
MTEWPPTPASQPVPPVGAVPIPPVASPLGSSPPAVPPVAPMPVPPQPVPPSPPVSVGAGLVPSARLLVAFPLPAEGGTVGSGEGNTLMLGGPGLATQHACFAREPDDRWTIEDLSGGQTLVSLSGDSAKLRAVVKNLVRDGSLIHLGGQSFVFRQPAAGPPLLETEISLPPAGVTIGSTRVCDVVVPGAAPSHAEIRPAAGRWIVTDLGTPGGTRVSYSGDPAQERPVVGSNALKGGSTIRIGRVKITLRTA